jgi:hypothetical protein
MGLPVNTDWEIQTAPVGAPVMELCPIVFSREPDRVSVRCERLKGD